MRLSEDKLQVLDRGRNFENSVCVCVCVALRRCMSYVYVYMSYVCVYVICMCICVCVCSAQAAVYVYVYVSYVCVYIAKLVSVCISQRLGLVQLILLHKVTVSWFSSTNYY
jgi:hypothetical protein